MTNLWDQIQKKDVSGFITPENTCIIQLYDKLKLDERTKSETLEMIWKYLNGLEYDKAVEWFFPCETISRGKGDCTDFSFLASSLLSRKNVPHKIIFGYVWLNGSNPTPHVWIDLGHGVIETTHEVGNVASKYSPILEVDVNGVDV